MRLLFQCQTVYLKKGETNMNSLKEKAAGVTDAMYAILGASGNTGSIIANFLLSKGREGARYGARRRSTAALCA